MNIQDIHRTSMNYAQIYTFLCFCCLIYTVDHHPIAFKFPTAIRWFKWQWRNPVEYEHSKHVNQLQIISHQQSNKNHEALNQTDELMRHEMRNHNIWILLVHWGKMTHKCVGKLNEYWFNDQAPSHYLNQCWLFLNSTLGDTFQWVQPFIFKTCTSKCLGLNVFSD